jgi:hypothetical protein
VITLFLHFLAGFGSVAVFGLGTALVAWLEDEITLMGGLLKIIGAIALMALAGTMLVWAVRPIFSLDSTINQACKPTIQVENP